MVSDDCLSEAAITTRIAADLPRWRLEDGHLVRRYGCNGWRASMLLAGAVAHLAELAWHHPDLVVRWDSVEVRLRTHSADGITEKDLALATMIEQQAAWRPSSGSALEGAPDEGQWRYLTDE